MLLKFIVAYFDHSFSVSSIYINFDRCCIVVTYISIHIHMNMCTHTCAIIWQDWKYCSIWCSSQTLPGCSLQSRCCMFVGYECTCNMIYTNRKVQPSIHRLSWDSQMSNSNTCRSHTKFHLNQKINVEILGGNSFKPIRNLAFSVLMFMKFRVAWEIFVDILVSNFIRTE